MNKKVILPLYVALCVLYLVYGRHCQPAFDSFFKALPSLFLMVLLLVSRKGQPDLKEWLLPFIALFFSILGDTAGEMRLGGLTLPVMMGFFAVAHGFYIASYSRYFDARTGLPRKLVFAGLLCIYLFAAAAVLIPRVSSGALMGGIVAYALIISMMCFFCRMQERPFRNVMVVGALIFFLSDSFIVFNKFVCHIPVRYLVMPTYYAAQLLINIPVVLNGMKNRKEP